MVELVDIEIKEPPDNVAILVVAKCCEESVISICKIDRVSLKNIIRLASVGFDGYEWEYDFRYEDIRYWIKLSDLIDLTKYGIKN